MPLETAQYIPDLQPDWPLGTDPESAGDDHIRQIKKAVKNTFPNLEDSPVTGTTTQLNNLTTHLVYSADNTLNGGTPENLECVNAADDDYIPMLVGNFTNAVAAAQAQAMAISFGWVMNNIYPVGSEFKSYTDNRNPAEILGFGTWEAVAGALAGVGLATGEDGNTFTYATGAAGFGHVRHSDLAAAAYSVTLTMDAVPDHAHNVGSMGSLEGGGGQSINPFPNDPQYQSSPAGGHTPTGSGSVSVGTATTTYAPIYNGAYTWKRTA